MNESNSPKVLILYASTHGQTEKICSKLAVTLGLCDLRVQVRDVHRHEQENPDGYDAVIVAASVHAGCEPVAGALLYREYNPFTRTLVRLISKSAGHSTDTSVDHEFTDWEALARFGQEIASEFRAKLESAPALRS